MIFARLRLYLRQPPFDGWHILKKKDGYFESKILLTGAVTGFPFQRKNLRISGSISKQSVFTRLTDD